MPKRRMTANRILQIKRWQLAGSKAKAGGLITNVARPLVPRIGYGGKMVDLYHRTSPANARKILMSQTFNPISGRPKAGFTKNWPTFFSTVHSGGSARYYGPVALHVRISRKKIAMDKAWAGVNHLAGGETHYEVGANALKGIKINWAKSGIIK